MQSIRRTSFANRSLLTAELIPTPLPYTPPVVGRETRSGLINTVATHIVDLRAEFEAQLRAVGRVEAELAKSVAGRDPANQGLADVLQRELAEMRVNNNNIRDVLNELATAARGPGLGR
jgi:hypothetical protein